jgi:U3 small nucleolar RNA-associated protein 14
VYLIKSNSSSSSSSSSESENENEIEGDESKGKEEEEEEEAIFLFNTKDNYSRCVVIHTHQSTSIIGNQFDHEQMNK